MVTEFVADNIRIRRQILENTAVAGTDVNARFAVGVGRAWNIQRIVLCA